MGSTHRDVSKLEANADGKLSTVSQGIGSDLCLDGWDGIALEYSVDWPLQLFFTQEVLSK